MDGWMDMGEMRRGGRGENEREMIYCKDKPIDKQIVLGSTTVRVTDWQIQ